MGGLPSFEGLLDLDASYYERVGRLLSAHELTMLHITTVELAEGGEEDLKTIEEVPMEEMAPELMDYTTFRELITIDQGYSQEIFDLLTDPGATGHEGMRHILDLARSDPEVLMNLKIPEETAEELLFFAKSYCKEREGNI